MPVVAAWQKQVASTQMPGLNFAWGHKFEKPGSIFTEKLAHHHGSFVAKGGIFARQNTMFLNKFLTKLCISRVADSPIIGCSQINPGTFKF